LKEKLALFERVPESAINRAAHTLLDLRETWESSTQDERKDLAHMMIQTVGCDVSEKRVLWIKVRPDYEPLFALLIGLHHDAEYRFWIEPIEMRSEDSGIAGNKGHSGMSVSTFSQMSNNVLTSAQEHIK
jgi:hypothetical protein